MPGGRSVVIGMAVAWAAYTLMFTGYVWVRGYDVGFLELVNPLNFYSGTWPPPTASPRVVIPGGRKGTPASKPPVKA